MYEDEHLEADYEDKYTVQADYDMEDKDLESDDLDANQLYADDFQYEQPETDNEDEDLESDDSDSLEDRGIFLGSYTS